MCCGKIGLIWLLLLMPLAAGSSGAESVAYRCTGRVLDTGGNLLAGAKVSFYATMYGHTTEDYSLTNLGVTTSDANGVFLFSTQPAGRQFQPYGTIMAEARGLAMGWRRWKLDEYIGVEITLGEPATVGGMVVDESGKAIADAEVGISMLFVGDDPYRRRFLGLEYGSELAAQTDSRGVFTFDNLPKDARMEFTVKKSGFVFVNTANTTLPISQRGQFRAGQRDIRIVVPAGGTIKGTVVDEAGNPISGVTLLLKTWYRRDIMDRAPVTSKQDGTFEFAGVQFGNYVLGMPQLRTGVTNWVFDPVEVKVRPDESPSNAIVRASKGGLVEFVVTEAESGKPVEDAAILLEDARTARAFFCRSDKNGIARIRLPAAAYSITSVSSDKGKPYPGQDFITIRAGTEIRKEIELFAFPTVSGVAVDREGGPIEGATVKTLPMGQIVLLSDSQRGYELTRTKTLLAGQQVSFTDAEGKFEATWYLDKLEQRQIRQKYLVLRHAERNLAAVREVADEQKAMTIEMMPAITVSGRVVDSDGRRIDRATTTLYMVVPGWRLVIGELLTQVNDSGEFEIGAVPRGHRFALSVSAEGYGVKEVRLTTESATGRRLELGDISLPRANLRISGIVVDSSDRPVPGARLMAYGRTSEVFHAVTDGRGRFVLDGVSDGDVVISAIVQGTMSLSGSVQTEASTDDVKIVVRDAGSAVVSIPYIPKGPPSLRNRDLPDLKELGVELPSEMMEGKILLVAFWDMNQRPSRHCITQLAERAEELSEEGVTVIAVQAVQADRNALTEWLKENKINLKTGIIKADHEKTISKWGVASLPWLILTDAEHKVLADGFSLSELNDTLKGNEQER